VYIPLKYTTITSKLFSNGKFVLYVKYVQKQHMKDAMPR
jgi:hypothetical protein